MRPFLSGDKKKTRLIDQAFEEMTRMLSQDHTLVVQATACLLSGAERSDEMRSLEEGVNSGERLIRRLVIEHLSMNPEQDLASSLTLLSVVYDVERIGDYASSLLELAELAPDLNTTSEAGSVVKALVTSYPRCLR